MFDSSMSNSFNFSLCKRFGFMIVFISMKEIGVNIGHTLGLKLIIIMCLVSKVCIKGFIMSFSTRIKSSVQYSCCKITWKFAMYQEVPYALISHHCTLETCQVISHCFLNIQCIMFSKLVSRNKSNNLNEAHYHSFEIWCCKLVILDKIWLDASN